MKKSSLIGLVALLFVFGIFAGLVSAAEYSYYKSSMLMIGDKMAYVNEKETTLDVAPYVKSGRTLVPLRFMESALGAAVKWDPATRTATLTTQDKEVNVTIGQKTAQVNGQAVALDVPAEIKGGRTFVPLRFISENMGATVEYDQDTQIIGITYVNTAGWKEFRESANGIAFKYPADWKVLSEDKTGIKFETPNGSIIEFKTETKDFAAVVKEKKDIHSKDGWQVAADEAIDPAKPNDGHTLSALKGTEPEKMEVYAAYIFKAGTGLYTLEFNGKIMTGETDAGILDYIYNNI